jgi:hypothetical protein
MLTRMARTLFLPLLCFLLFAGATPAQAQQSIKVYVTVDWEGYNLEPENIEAMQAFRVRFPHIPILQLLNPVYFVRPNANHAHIKASIQATLLPADAHGLHLHGWKSLMEYCQVPYQHQPSFADIDEQCTQGDCGYTVSLEYAYSTAALTKLVACSQAILVQHGFHKPVHFRAGGWQLGSKLTQALANNGFTWDSSRTAAALLTSRWEPNSGLVSMVNALHPHSTPLEQPYALTSELQEYPNNASLADYTGTGQIVDMFTQLIEQQKSVMVLGFHQETAVDFSGRLAAAIPKMEAIAKEKGVKIEWVSR